VVSLPIKALFLYFVLWDLGKPTPDLTNGPENFYFKCLKASIGLYATGEGYLTPVLYFLTVFLPAIVLLRDLDFVKDTLG